MNRLAGIDPGAIAAELRAMWRAAGAEKGDDAVMRAAMLNLVVCSVGDPQAESETVARIAASLPCRAIILVPVPPSDTGPPLEAWTSLHCRADSRGKQVCCEQIMLRVQSAAVDALPSAVWALLLPDLPTALWVPGAFDLESPLIAALHEGLDGLVTDTADSKTPARDLVRLAAWRQEGLAIADLAWSRIEAWREGFASFFDAAPFDAALSKLESVDIEAGRAGHAEALLFRGWITSRLGWASGDPRLHVVQTAGTGLQRVAASTAQARFILEVDPVSSRTLHGRIETQGECPLPWRLEKPQRDADAELIGLLQRTRRNVAYEEALAALAAALEPHARPA